MNFSQIKKINLKQKLATNTVIFVVSFSAIFYFAIYMASQSINDLRAQVIAGKIEVEKRINREENMSNLAIKLKKIEGELEKVNGVFIDKNEKLEFITTLENIANYNNINQNINLLPVDNAIATITKSLININARGEYIDAVNYLRDIESLSYHINISTIGFSRIADDASGEEKSIVSLNFTADTYWK